MNLGEALYREIAGRSPRTEPQTLGQSLAVVVSRAGSVSAAARNLGMPRRTLRDYLSGKRRPAPTVQDDVRRYARQIVRRERLPKGREKRMRRADALADVKVTGGYVYGSTAEPDRDVALGDYLDEVQNDVLDAYLAGDDLDEIADVFAAGISGADFYERTFDPNNPDEGWDIEELDGWR